MTWLEIWELFGVVTALIYVFLASRGLRSCFVFGLISSVVFVDICFRDKLYFDTAINSYYVVMSIVGWINWNTNNDHIHVSSFTSQKFISYGMIALVVSLISGYITSEYTDASLPYIDSFTTVFAILATWMLVKKILENWIIWIAVDAISVAMYSYKGHIWISILFVVYTIIAFYGYFHWRKDLLTHD